MSDNFTVADLVAMPHLGLELVAGGQGETNPVLWTHVSELPDPGPWCEGGELLIVNGLGIPEDPEGQVDYVARLAHHRLAGLVVSIKGPELTPELVDEADRLSFPVLRLPRTIPFVEFSHLVATGSERSTKRRLTRHLEIFETLRLRNGADKNIVEIYTRLEQISGYRLAVVSPACRPLLREWRWVPDELAMEHLDGSEALRVIPGGYVLPIFVGNRASAYLVGTTDRETPPGGLAALQHVSSLVALDAIDDQRRRESVHRQGSTLLAIALDHENQAPDMSSQFLEFGMDPSHGLRFLAFAEHQQETLDTETSVRDWFADRDISHLLLKRKSLLAVINCSDEELGDLAETLGIDIGTSSKFYDLDALPKMQRQAVWSLSLAEGSPGGCLVLAEQQLGLSRWLNPDVETMLQLADSALRPIIEHDADHGTALQLTLTEYFRNNGRLRPTAARLFVHEHTLSYRLKRIEQLTARNLKDYRGAFELWLALEASSLINDA